MVETPFGPFVKEESGWSGDVEVGDKILDVVTEDADGRPSPEQLRRLPALLAQLPELERMVRRQVERVTDRHELTSLSDMDADGTGFTLHFSYDEEAWGETVLVDFRAGQIVGWTAVD